MTFVMAGKTVCVGLSLTTFLDIGYWLSLVICH